MPDCNSNQYTNVTEFVEKLKCGVGLLFTFSAFTGKMTRHIIYCKKRSCPNCEEYWRKRHLNRLQERETNLAYHGVVTSDYHVVLTTAYRVEKEKVYAAFRYFFQQLRSKFDCKVEYFCSVEQNRKASQPHFHFILSFVGKKVDFLDYKMIRKQWLIAQRWAQFEKLANQTFCKLIKGDNKGWYMLKYITKGDSKKYEVPQKEVWNGRTVRASRGFYPVATKVLDMAFQSRKTLSDPTQGTSIHFELLPRKFLGTNQACGGRLDLLKEFVQPVALAKRDWNFNTDICSSDSTLKPSYPLDKYNRTLVKAVELFDVAY